MYVNFLFVSIRKAGYIYPLVFNMLRIFRIACRMKCRLIAYSGSIKKFSKADRPSSEVNNRIKLISPEIEKRQRDRQTSKQASKQTID